MTSNNIIIIGYKLKAKQYNNIRDLQQKVRTVLSEKVLHKLPTLERGPALLFINPSSNA